MAGPGPFIAATGPTTTDGTEQTLFAAAAIGVFQLRLSRSAMLANDTIEIRQYITDKAGGTVLLEGLIQFTGPAPTNNQIYRSEEVVNGDTTSGGVKWTIKRTAGTDRAYQWTVHNFYDGTVNATQWNSLATVALPLVPTVAGRTLDVSTGGEAGLDWANIGSQSTTVNLSDTSIKLTTAAIVNGVWRDATAGDFQQAGTIGLSIMNGVALGTGLTVNDLTTKTGFTLSATGSAALTEGYPAKGGTGTIGQILYTIMQRLEEAGISGTTRTILKRDQATTAMTDTLDSATTPAVVTRAT